MVKFLAHFFVLVFFLLGCSKADQQSAGSRVPSPGLDHLVQVYMVADLANAGPLALNFLSVFGSSVPNSKLYVARPENIDAAENALREWSARSMDWLVVSGKASRAAFLKSKISWVNTKRIIVIGEVPLKAEGQSVDAKLVSLVFKPDLLSKWSREYCASQKKSPECSKDGDAQIFGWSHALETTPGALVEVAWGWTSFLRTTSEDLVRKSYDVSFRDGFLSLNLRPAIKSDDQLGARLQQWIRQQALAGLSK